MQCKDAEQLIQNFINDDLTGEPLANFVRHIDHCHSCYEEMETSYLLKEALSRLEMVKLLTCMESLRISLSI